MVFPFPVQHPPVPTTTIGGSVRPTRTTNNFLQVNSNGDPSYNNNANNRYSVVPDSSYQKLTSDRPVAQWVKASRRGRGYGRMRGPSKNGLRVK